MTLSVRVQNVSFAYQSEHWILRDLSFTVEPGTFLAVVGPNGAGKSTLINLIAGLLAPNSGAISLDGRDVRSHGFAERATRIAVVRQEFVPVFGVSVAEAVLMARTAHYGPLGFESDRDRELATRAMEATDTLCFASRPLASLSGGERQRVFIARALAQDTPILLMDEPTSFLDLKHQVAIYDLLKTIGLQEAKTIIAVTHDINLASQYCDEAILLPPRPDSPATRQEGRPPTQPPPYRVGPPAEVFTTEGIEQAFGVKVFSGAVGSENFFIPLGKMAKDAAWADRP